MNSYLEITLLPGQEVGLSFLWEKVFYQIHLALVEQLDKNGHAKVGVSFPEYCCEANKKGLGEKLRLFSREKKHLEQLDIKRWFNRLNDYVHITSIRPVPHKMSGYAFYKREHTKSGIERIVRRKAKRQKISEEEARKQLNDFKPKYSDAPFINMRSSGTKQKFKLFIVKKRTETLVGETFGSYGLGIESSVPEFF